METLGSSQLVAPSLHHVGGTGMWPKPAVRELVSSPESEIHDPTPALLHWRDLQGRSQCWTPRVPRPTKTATLPASQIHFYTIRTKLLQLSGKSFNCDVSYRHPEVGENFLSSEPSVNVHLEHLTDQHLRSRSCDR